LAAGRRRGKLVKSGGPKIEKGVLPNRTGGSRTEGKIIL